MSELNFVSAQILLTNIIKLYKTTGRFATKAHIANYDFACQIKKTNTHQIIQ